MTSTKAQRLDVMPLLKFVQGHDDWNILAFANRMGLNGNNHAVYRYLREGIPVYSADKICCKHLGIHPANVWPDWYRHVR